MTEGYAHPEILISPEELKALLEARTPRLRVLDVRPRLLYYLGHIPGAVRLWRPDIEEKGHFLPGMMASKSRMEKLLSRLGVNCDHTMVIYSYRYDHARLWWILAYYGFPLTKMKLLNGGINAWRAKGYPLQFLPPFPRKGDFRLPGAPHHQEPLCCTLPEVKEALADPQKVVLDVRSRKEFFGEKKLRHANKPGRIPGVISVPWEEVLVPEGELQGYFKPGPELRGLFAARGVTPDKHIYIY